MHSAKRLFIFAAYDKDSFIDDNTIFYLQHLSKLGDIIFVFDGYLPRSELTKINNSLIHSICINHGEYDFGSYKQGYLWAKEKDILKDYESLTLINDSVFGPFHSLNEIYKQMENKDNTDFWGVFACEDDIPFVHSYFICLNQNIFLSDIFNEFISKVKKQKDKRAIVIAYEKGLTQLLVKNNFKYSALMSSSENLPFCDKAIELIKEGFPFLKKSLFNPKGSEDLGCGDLALYKNLLDQYTQLNYPIHYIEETLSRTIGRDLWTLQCSKKYSYFERIILHKKFIRLSGKYKKNNNYQFSVKVLGITIFKKTIDSKSAYRSPEETEELLEQSSS